MEWLRNAWIQGTTAVERAPRTTIATLGLIALSLRLLYIWETHQQPFFWVGGEPGLDIDLHWRAADHILEGREFSFERVSLSAPLFAYLIAGWKWIAGDSWYGFKIFYAIQGSVRVVMLFWLCRRWGSSVAAAAVPAALTALLPSLIYFDTVPLKASFELTLLTALLLTASAGADQLVTRAALRGAAIAGLAILLFLSQLSTVLFAVALIPYLLFSGSAPLPRRLLTVGPLVIGLPAALLLYRATPSPDDRANFLDARGGGYEMLMGTSGRLRVDDIPGHPLAQRFHGRVAVEARLRRVVSGREADRHYRDRALERLASDPARHLRHALRKTRVFFNAGEPAGMHWAPLVTDPYWSSSFPAGFRAMLVLAALALPALWRREQRATLLLCVGLVGATWLGCLISWVSWRFRLPALVALAPLAAIGVDNLGAFLKDSAAALPGWSRRRMTAALFLPALVAVVFASLPTGDHRDSIMDQLGQNYGVSVGHFRAAAEHHLTGDISLLTRARDLEQLTRWTELFSLLEAHEEELLSSVELSRHFLHLLVMRAEYERAARFLAAHRAHSPESARELLRLQHPAVRTAITAIALSPEARDFYRDDD